MKTNYYQKKLWVCYDLTDLKVKKVTDCHILEVAKKNKIPFSVAKNAWRVFQETGGKTVDKRGKGGKTIKMNPSVKPLYTKKRTVLAKEAAAAILEYMTTDIKSVEVCNKYRVNPNQFYEWIHELQVSGTLLGKKVLNHNKYAKIEVLDAIRLVKKPDTKRKSITALSELELIAYERVGDVLQKYLSAIAEG